MTTDSAFQEFQASINYTFRNTNNLIEALTHPSYSAENLQVKRDNQRLEFLGDAVLEIIITQRIYFLFPEYSEGELTKIRAALSKESTLAQFAREIHLGKYLRVGHGERRNKGYNRNSILSDAFEALIGAIFVDCGGKLDAANEFATRLMEGLYNKTDLETLVKTENPKGLLQEWAQKNVNEAPEYKTIDEIGPDHQKLFRVEVYIKQECMGQGEAGKRQAAEELAARSALEKIKLALKNY